MTLEWLLRTLITGVLLGVGALAAERVLGWFRLPRRGAWAAAMAGTLLLPLIALAAPGLLPGLRLPTLASRPIQPAPDASVGRETGAMATREPPPGGAIAGPNLPRAAAVGWLVSSLATLAALGWSYARLRSVRGRCTAAVVDGAAVLLAERAGPMVLGVRDPAVILPRWVLDAPPEERGLIVRHEVEHLLGGDAELLLLSTLAVAVMPWNPALWWQHRRLQMAVETDCDARVLARGGSIRAYGRVLLRTAARSSFLPALALALGERRSHLERRIVDMTGKRPSHPLPRAIPRVALALVAAAAACGVAGGPRPGPPGDGDRPVTLDTFDGQEFATRQMPDGSYVTVARQEHRPEVGYTGVTELQVEKMPWVIRSGRREPRPLERFPVIGAIDAESPAAKAGLREGDVLLAVDGHDARQPTAGPDRIGVEQVWRVRRGERELELRLVTIPQPPRQWPPSPEWFDENYRRSRRVAHR